MAAKILKYNPSFLSDQELVEAFVVRHASLALILEVVRENTHETNQHLLVIGPRGSGKTTLVRRVAAAIRETPEMNAQWFPLTFGEESYEVTTAGEFWLEAIHHLGVQTGDSKWGRIYDELLQEPDERRLSQRCLANLLDFADSIGKRLLLLVENLNLMLREQISDDDAWALRETLMHESRLMLLGSATSRFDAITNQNKAMFELFREIELSRLAVEECRKVWNRVAEQEITEDQARAVQILTGGNPRLLTILAVFGANRSFRSLLEDLSLMVDEHTDYFKSNFENLPPVERKVFACLATLWEDSLAGDVARAARMSTSQVSALLRRLEGRGAVQAVHRKGGKKRYQLAERLYNIYYLMRRGQEGGRVWAVVHFMMQYYGKERLPEAAAVIAREACSLMEGQREEHYLALQILWDAPEARDMLERIRGELPTEFFQLPDIPEDLKQAAATGDIHLSPELKAVRTESMKALKEKRWEDAVNALYKAVELDPLDAYALTLLGSVLAYELNRPEEGVIHLRKAVELDPTDAGAWATLGSVLANELDQPEEGVAYLRKAVEFDPKYARAWGTLGSVLAYKLGQAEEGVAYLRKAVELDPKYARAWGTLGSVLAYKLGQAEEGVAYLRKAVELDPKYARAWGTLGSVLAYKLGQAEEGVAYLRKAVELDPKYARAWGSLGEVLANSLDQPEEGVDHLRKAVELDPSDASAWSVLGCVLLLDLDKNEEGMDCLGRAAALDPTMVDNWYFCTKIQNGLVPIATIEAILSRTGRPAGLLNSVAYVLMNGENYENLEAIEAWTREAVEQRGAAPYCHGTLARVLALRGAIPEALAHTALVFEHPEIIRRNIQASTDILATAAALGYGQEALDLLLASPSSDVLEPVAAGLRQYLGLEVHAPQEVKEIADDIVKRIEYWKEWHADSARRG